MRPRTSTREVHTAVPVSKLSMNIQINVPEPKALMAKRKMPNLG